jgi:hypothetical protein
MASAAKAKTSDKKTDTVKLSGEFFPAEIKEGTFGDTTGKREMVVTLMREGPGNKFLNNWYTRPALESARAWLADKKKQYFNHAANIDNPDRDVRDWASSIVETWIAEDAGRNKLMGRVRVYDNWLWERAQQAPDELAVSMEAKGRGRVEVIEGQRYNAIYEIPSGNGVQWVDYPGNAGMGVRVLEKNQTQEDAPMDAKAILEGIKALSEDERAEIVETLAPKADAVTEKQLAEVRESVAAVKAEAATQKKALEDRVAAVEAEKTALTARVEAHDIKERAAAKEKMVDALLASSKLKDDHKTPTFRSTLLGVKEYKAGDKTVSEQDQMKALIEDREKICVAEVAAPPAGGAPAAEVKEEDKRAAFMKNVLGVVLPKEPAQA